MSTTPHVRDFLLCANWKMNKNPESAKTYLQDIKKLVPKDQQKHFVFLAPALTLFVLQKELNQTAFAYGGQNCHFADQGAFTGENSPSTLKALGGSYCLVGHSERRQLFLENDSLIQKKVEALIKHSLTPIICIGERDQQLSKSQVFQVLEKQLSGILNSEAIADNVPLVIAYEPVWAIGSARPAKAQHIAPIYQHIQKLFDRAGKKQLRFLYGGSVNQDNAKELSQIQGIKGFLVGGASLSAQNFFKLFQKI